MVEKVKASSVVAFEVDPSVLGRAVEAKRARASQNEHTHLQRFLAAVAATVIDADTDGRGHLLRDTGSLWDERRASRSVFLCRPSLGFVNRESPK